MGDKWNCSWGRSAVKSELVDGIVLVGIMLSFSMVAMRALWVSEVTRSRKAFWRSSEAGEC